MDDSKRVKMYFIWQSKFILFSILVLSISMSMSMIEQTDSFLSWQYENEVTKNFSQALNDIVNTLFVDSLQRRVFNFQIGIQPKNKQFSYIYYRIVDRTVKLLNDSISIILNNDMAIPVDNERHFCVILVDSAKSLEFLYKDLITYHPFVEGSYFIILLTFPNINHYYDDLFEIFELNWNNGITHADVLIHEVENSILMFHSMPFTLFHCKDVAPIVHNRFSNGRWSHQKFVTAKSKNLFGCPLICATWEDLPYFKVGERKSLQTTNYQGIEGKMLEYLATKMNFTIKIRWMDDDEINQTIYDEEEVLNKLFSTGTDFVIGAFRYKPTTLEDTYAPTTIYYMSNYHFVVSSRTDPYDPFTKLLLSFHSEIWIILIFIFIFGNLTVFMVIYLDHTVKYFMLGHGNKTPTYNMVVISLGGAVAKDPKIPFSRFLLMLWLLATFILRTVYQGFMYHFIRSDLHKPRPKLINDLLTSEYRILVSEVVYSSITDVPLLYEKAELLNVSEKQAFKMLRHPENYEPFKLAILTAYEYFGYYKYMTQINRDFYVVPEKLFTQPLSVYMQKNSVYLKRFNLYIKSYINNGLMDHWESFLVLENSVNKHFNESPKAINFQHLVGVFRLFLIGLTISLVVFLAEILCFVTKRIYWRLRRKWRKMMKSRKNQFVL